MPHFASLLSKIVARWDLVSGQGTGDDPPAPSDEVLEALTVQCTTTLLKRVRRYAARRIAGLQSLGYPVDDFAARELVQDVLHDIARGKLPWDPSTKSLESYVIDVLHQRTKRLLRRADRYRRVSLDAEQGNMTGQDEVDAMLVEQAARPEVRLLASGILAELRDLARDDALVLAMLDAFAQGAVTRSDVLSVANLSAIDYHNGRRRLDRLITRLAERSRTTSAKGPNDATS